MAGSRGVTLLEAVIALAFAAITAGLGVVQLVELVHGAHLAGAARTLATAMRLARGQALAGLGPMEVRFDVAGASWQVSDGGGATLERHQLPPGVVFAGLPVRPRIQFGALGTADNGTITLSAGLRTRRVIVNQRGRVRVQ